MCFASPDIVERLLECGANIYATDIHGGDSFMAGCAFSRMGISKSVLIKFLANESGITPLNKSVVRGDVEIVKIFLENGTDPYVENDLGMNAFEICEKSGPFPSVTKALLEFERKVQ